MCISDIHGNIECLNKAIEKFGEENARVIHVNKGQNTRINAINSFKSGEIRVLVATDVAERGQDVSNVSHVINFDVPIVIEDYVHRIGRTGRAFNDGVSITFANESEVYYLKKIEKLIRQSIPVNELPEEVFVEKTPYEERQAIAREIDNQKKKDNPDYQGAFHEKKHAAKIEETQRLKAKKAAGKVKKMGVNKAGFKKKGKKFKNS